jgi:hypothetical protein
VQKNNPGNLEIAIAASYLYKIIQKQNFGNERKFLAGYKKSEMIQ